MGGGFVLLNSFSFSLIFSPQFGEREKKVGSSEKLYPPYFISSPFSLQPNSRKSCFPLSFTITKQSEDECTQKEIYIYTHTHTKTNDLHELWNFNIKFQYIFLSPIFNSLTFTITKQSERWMHTKRDIYIYIYAHTKTNDLHESWNFNIYFFLPFSILSLSQ